MSRATASWTTFQFGHELSDILYGQTPFGLTIRLPSFSTINSLGQSKTIILRIYCKLDKMTVQLSAGYVPIGPQVQIQISGGAYVGNFLGLSVDEGYDGSLTAVQPAQAVTFTLDQAATNCKLPLTCLDCSFVVMGVFNSRVSLVRCLCRQGWPDSCDETPAIV